VVNDGSKDATFAVLREQFNLVPIHPIYRRQIDTKASAGVVSLPASSKLARHRQRQWWQSPMALAIRACNWPQGQLVCAMDADTLIEPMPSCA